MTTTLFVQFCSQVAARWGAQVDYWLTEQRADGLRRRAATCRGASRRASFSTSTATIAVVKAEALAHATGIRRDPRRRHGRRRRRRRRSPRLGRQAPAYVSPARPDERSRRRRGRSTSNTCGTSGFYNAIVLGNWDDDFDGNYTGPNDLMGDPRSRGAPTSSASTTTRTPSSARPRASSSRLRSTHRSTSRTSHGPPEDRLRLGHLPRGLRHGRGRGEPLWTCRSSSPRTASPTADVNRPRFLSSTSSSLAGPSSAATTSSATFTGRSSTTSSGRAGSARSLASFRTTPRRRSARRARALPSTATSSRAERSRSPSSTLPRCTSPPPPCARRRRVV